MKDTTIDRIFMIATAIAFVIVIGWLTWDIYATSVAHADVEWAEQVIELQRIADANYANMTQRK